MSSEQKGLYYFPVVYQTEPSGQVSVSVVGLEEIHTGGDDLESAKARTREAIQSHLLALTPQELGELEPYTMRPEESTMELVEVHLNNDGNE